MMRQLVTVLVSIAVTALAAVPLSSRATVVRIIQTNGAGDNAHVIESGHQQGGRHHQGRRESCTASRRPRTGAAST